MNTIPILIYGRNLISSSCLGSKMRDIPDGVTFKAQSGFSVSYWFQLLFTALSFLFISAMWRFSLLGSFKHEMFYSKFLFWEQKGREFHLCLVYFTQNEKEKKKQKKVRTKWQTVETMRKITVISVTLILFLWNSHQLTFLYFKRYNFCIMLAKIPVQDFGKFRI